MNKRIITVFAALIITFGANAQKSFSCYYREYCAWNSTTQVFEKCEGSEESSLFEWNESMTMFTHTISSLKSTYYLKSKRYDSENKVWIYTVTSDVGNNYIYVFDEVLKEVKVLITSGSEIKMARFYVKSIF